ncbi:HAD family hydrolase [Paenibacillus silviterrae]|uniref:HAD family hydrolase n=1 Tax=Paenibacillus silviterrae TaxID=3242194 RepID=UPI002543564F|nr:HAD family hydrolase [Paenibacillus chinjuensis]
MKAPLPKAILLDMDDTIIAYDQGVDTDMCWRASIDKHLSIKEAFHTDELVLKIKQTASQFWSDPERHRIGRLDLYKARQSIIAQALQQYNIEDSSLAGHIAIAYGEERDRAVTLFPDSIEVITHFRRKGIKLALLTNGNAVPQWNKIRRFELAPLFDCILVEGEFGIGKPEERIYLHALERLGVTADEAWMIGDNFEWEIAAPQRLGIKGIWVDHKGAGIPAHASAQPYMIIKSLGDLLSVM